MLVPRALSWQLGMFPPEPGTVFTRTKYFPIITKNGNKNWHCLHCKSQGVFFLLGFGVFCKASSAWNCHSTGNKGSTPAPSALLQHPNGGWSKMIPFIFTSWCWLRTQPSAEYLTQIYWVGNETALPPCTPTWRIPRKALLLPVPATPPSRTSRFRDQWWGKQLHKCCRN